MEAAPVEAEKPTDAPADKSDSKSGRVRPSRSDAVYLTVNVPDGASVSLNGRPTTSTGNRRTYVSRGVTAGNRYKYEIQAKMDQDGTPRIENRVVYARAGEHPEVQFSLDIENEKTQLVDELPANEAEKTTLRIHVPADAKVFLAGQATKSTGPVRVFQTSRLADGQRWKDIRFGPK